MDSQNRYILINDDCECCQYTSHAFTLLRLPLNKVTLSNLCAEPELLKDAYTLIACTNSENQQAKRLREFAARYNTSIISFNERLDDNEAASCFYLKMPFSQFEIKYALSQSAKFKDEDQEVFDSHPIFNRLIGTSSHIRKIKSMIKQVAASDSTVLILGQSGTGKDVIASCIHKISKRHSNPLVPINCGAIPSELMESELFGHEKGAFTGALTRRAGRFEMADTGTLFLDEIGDMPLPMQVKLLRVIQDRMIERVGGNQSIKIDVRLIAATNKHLEELIKENRFREDLFYRLNVFPIRIPSLAERSDDIPILISYYLDKIYERIKHKVGFTKNVVEILCEYPWPGNIRELENFLERMVILYPDRIVDENDIDPMYKSNKTVSTPSESHKESININEYIAEIEEQIIKVALEKSNGIISSAAKYLHLKKATLLEKMKKYKLETESA